MKNIKEKILLIILTSLVITSVYAQYDVEKSGATGDGKTLDTKSIQSAIDKAYANGGGVVEFGPGKYLIGTLILKDNVELHLQSGALLLGSPEYKDYTEIIHKFESRTNGLYTKYFMVFAEGAKNISITGQGIMHGNGLKNFQKSNPQNQRPFMVRLVNCENVLIRDVKLLESANWTLHLLGCRDVNIDGVVIENGIDSNRDGLDIDCCERVTVANCRFSTGDDAIVMKASSDVLCQDITITNCIIRTRASAIKTGTESNGGFKNITVSNCIVRDIPRHAGIELMTVDGGTMENILLDNITMENVATPIFIRVGIRVRPFKPGQYVSKVDDVRDIFLNNITVVNATLPSSIMGLHNRRIKNVVVTNYNVRNLKAQVPTAYNKVPFLEFDYPAAIFFENLPAFALYCRNVDELHLQNLYVSPADNDLRPAFTFDRVSNLELFSLKAGLKSPATPLAHFRNSTGIMASYCRTIGKGDLLFEEEENSVDNLVLSGNILQPGQKEIVKVPALKDEKFFEDFKTDLKYSVESGESIKGLTAMNLKIGPLKFNMNMTKRGSLQLCLLILNESSKPGKVLIRYQGITQEFTIDWNEWGWAPVTLVKEYPADEKVDFEIRSADPASDLKIAKVYFRYQDVKKTD